jgi:type I restriction enzyme S subunit
LVTSKAVDVARANFSLADVNEIPVPLCSLPAQQEIVRLLDEQFEAIERNERELDAALQRSEALRQAILKKAFSGRLVPQDPADPPASTLLARLRAGQETVVATHGRSSKKRTASNHPGAPA